MPPKRAKPRPVVWRVTGGKTSGGLIVRQGPETTSPECVERLATHSVVRELEVQGERMRYQLVTGSGPQTGWISTKFKGKDQLKTRQLKAWIIATGTRGDIQPYLALALGMKDAGYDMTIWTCEDYESFVQKYGIRMCKISGSVEDLIKTSSRLKSAAEYKDKEGKDRTVDADETDASSLLSMLSARWNLSLQFDVSVGGMDARRMDPVPPEVEAKVPKDQLLGHVWTSAGTLEAIGFSDVAARYWSCAERLQRELEAEAAEAGGAAAEQKPEELPAPPSGEQPPAPSGEQPPAPSGEQPPFDLEWEALTREASAAPGSGFARVMEEMSKLPDWEAAAGAVKTYLDNKSYWQQGEHDMGVSMMMGGIEGLFMRDLASDESYLKGFLSELQTGPPDIVLHNIFWYGLALAAEAYCGAPTVCLHLQPDGISFSDPHAQWVSDETYPFFRTINPECQAYPTLAEAREHFLVQEPTTDYGAWARQVIFEELFLEPCLGHHPIRDMGPDRLWRRLSERHLVGFLTSIASERFLKFMGDFSRRQVAKHSYTGFWIMDDQHQTGAASSDMFGGPELMRTIEDFIAAGDPPAYIGWGSCVCGRGREWMIALAVAALKKADMRGIVLEGWAELSLELLEALVDGDDGMGLVDYARRNVLFVKRAPQVWLFPRCSVVVIHGGVGTLAAAWTSGTPLVICAVWLDQFGNSLLNTLMGAGVQCQCVDATNPEELAGCLRAAVADPRVRQGAQAVQFSMAMDKGIQTAMEHIDSVLLEEVPSGRWHQWWL